MTKKERLALILNIINEDEISTQEELTEKLNLKGYDISQSTISRDINELNLIKAEGVEKRFKYVQANLASGVVSTQMISVLKQIMTSVSYANNLVVIKTLSGNAGAAGMAVDGMHLPQILGSVAGDDTLLVIAKSNSDAEIVVKILRNL